MSENSCSVHTPHVSPCTESSGFAWVCPQPEEIVTNRQQDCLRLPTTPTVQGGWTTCARVRRLPMPIACLSSAMASGSHGTGHGVAVGRGRSGRRLSGVGRFFRFRPLLSDLELQQAPRGRMTRGISSAKLATTGFPGSGTRRTLSALDARGTESSVHGSTESSREVSARGITTMCGLYSCVTSFPFPRGTRDAHRTTTLVHYRRPNLTS